MFFVANIIAVNILDLRCHSYANLFAYIFNSGCGGSDMDTWNAVTVFARFQLYSHRVARNDKLD